MENQNNFNKNFYCMDIDNDSISVAYFAIAPNNEPDIKLLKKINISNIITNGILNISALNKTIGKIINATQNHSEEKIESIFLSSNILKINSYIKKISLDVRDSKLINNMHIKESLDILQNTLTVSLKSDETALQIIPAQYDIDGYNFEGNRQDNPIGFKSSNLTTTYNVITANKSILDTIKNIFEKNYQIKISDIIPHHQALKLSLTDYIEKLSSTIVIDVKNQITNISLIHRSKLVKCISKTNTYEIPNDISDYNLYNIMQHIKSQIPEVILRPAKNIVIYGNIDSNISTNNIALKVFEKNCSIIDATNSTQKPINGLVKHANTQAMNEKNYWGISNKKLNIISLLKDIIDENL